MTSFKRTHDDFVNEMKGINPDVEVIGKYLASNKKVECLCKICGNVWNPIANQLRRGSRCPECRRRERFITNDEFLSRMKNVNTNIKFLTEYSGSDTKIKCECLIDGYKWSSLPGNLLNGKGCPVCARNITVSGINDVATIRPDLVKYFKNKYEAKGYTPSSKKRLLFVCPDCGYIKEMSIHCLSISGFSCDLCSDGISYPNKFSRALIQQLPVTTVEYEYMPDFIKPYRYKYDNYFEFIKNGNLCKVILEMDGAFHYEYMGYSRSLEECIEADKTKDFLAIENGIKIIRIDSRVSSKEYISKNILDSELAELFDLSNINWDYCDKVATTSLVKTICNYYNQSENKGTTYLKSVFHMSFNTISNYLKRGAELGFCDYSLEKAENERIKNCVDLMGKTVIVFDDKHNYIGAFKATTICAKELSNIYNINFDPSSIAKVCRGVYKTYKGFTFKYVA